MSTLYAMWRRLVSIGLFLALWNFLTNQYLLFWRKEKIVTYCPPINQSVDSVHVEAKNHQFISFFSPVLPHTRSVDIQRADLSRPVPNGGKRGGRNWRIGLCESNGGETSQSSWNVGQRDAAAGKILLKHYESSAQQCLWRYIIQWLLKWLLLWCHSFFILTFSQCFLV